MELKASANHKHSRFREMRPRFRKLGTPISSQLRRACAPLTSERVGATRHCCVKLLAPKSKVLSALMAKCSHKLDCLIS